MSDLPSQVACVVPRGDGSEGTFNPDQWMEPKDQRKVDDFIIFAMCAAKQALDDAGHLRSQLFDLLRARVLTREKNMVSPLGCGVEPTWKRILNGESGARRIESFDVSDLQTKIACTVVRGDGSNDTFNPDKWMEPKDQRKVDDFIIYAMPPSPMRSISL